VVIGTSKDGDGFRDGVVFDTGHGLTTFGTNGTGCRNGFGFWQNRVDIFGGFHGNKVSCVWKKKMTATVEALVYSLSLAIGGIDSD